MTRQMQDFFHHYRVMDTRILLARYRSGGLLPGAKTTLLDVLTDRGYTVAALESNGTNEITTPRVEDGVDAHSSSMKARQSFSTTWRSLKHEMAAFALQAKARARLRKTWTQIVWVALLATCWWSMLLASLFGVGLFITANVFCDHGPLARCFRIGLQFLDVGLGTDALLIPAVIALVFPKKWITWYLKAVPVLSLAVFVAAIYWYRILPTVCAMVAEMSALIAFLATAYLILSRKPALAPAPKSASKSRIE